MGAIFSAFVQTGPGTHQATYAMGLVKRPGSGVDHPSYLELKLKKECDYTCITPLGLRGLSLGELCLLRFYNSIIILQ